MPDTLECSKCGTDRPEYDVTTCTVCLDKATCCDCASELHRELQVCSDECAVEAVSNLKLKLRSAHRAIREMREVCEQIKEIAPQAGQSYAYALGRAQGQASLGIASSSYVWKQIEKEAA